MADSQWSAQSRDCKSLSLSGSWKEPSGGEVIRKQLCPKKTETTKKKNIPPGVLLLENNQQLPQWTSSWTAKFQDSSCFCRKMDLKAKSCQTQHLKMPQNVRLRATTGQYWRPLQTSIAYNKRSLHNLLTLTDNISGKFNPSILPWLWKWLWTFYIFAILGENTSYKKWQVSHNSFLNFFVKIRRT